MSPAPHPLEPDDHRRARHLYVLKGLTDRAATLANKAADQAEAEFDAPDPPPDAPRTPAALTPQRTFERYVRLVHLLIALEHRIATNAAQPGRPHRPTTQIAPNADPRRAQLREFLHQATRHSPDRAKVRRDANTSLDEALERDKDLTLPAGAILCEICELYGLPFDITKIPDEFLDPPVTSPPITGPPRPT